MTKTFRFPLRTKESFRIFPSRFNGYWLSVAGDRGWGHDITGAKDLGGKFSRVLGGNFPSNNIIRQNKRNQIITKGAKYE